MANDKKYDKPYSHPRWYELPPTLTCFCNHCKKKVFVYSEVKFESKTICDKYPKGIPRCAREDYCDEFIAKEGTTQETIDKINEDTEYKKQLKELNSSLD